MIQKYLQKAMEVTHYELLEDDEGFYGEIPGATGVWATGKNLEACRTELLEVLEEWVIIGIARGHDLPEFDGVTIKVESVNWIWTGLNYCDRNKATLSKG